MEQRIVPMVAYEDAAAAIDWLAAAFGFAERGERYVMDDGTVGHAEIEYGGSVVFVATPEPRVPRARARTARRARQPPAGSTTRGSSTECSCVVDDLDAHHARAVAAGATIIRPLEDGPVGRLYTAEDLEGHRWMFQQA